MKSPYPLYRSTNPLFDDANQLDIFKGKSFLEFNDIIGLPVKNGIEHPIYDYELDVIDKIESNRNIWIKKASGIGMTELILRYLAYKIVSSNELEDKKIMIVSGTMLKHANNVKERLQALFEKRFPLIQLESKFTEMWLKRTNIICMPSRNVKDIRGWTDISYLFIDEADYFEPSVTAELEHAITRYEEKSNCTTIMVSTPNRPGGLFESIEKDHNSKYEKIILTYEVGLDKIYNRKEIEKKKNEPEFLREYAGQYLGKVGNLLLPSQIQTCIDLGQEYSIDKIPVSLYTLKSVGFDPGFSSSATGIVVLEHIKPDNLKDKIRFIETYNIEKGDPNQIVNLCWDIWERHNWMNTFFFIDGSNRAMVNLLKIKWQESLNWESKDTFGPNTRIRPVNFSTEHRNMLSNLHAIITKSYLAIDEKHDKLITSLRTAYADELNLKKEQTSYDDLFRRS